LDNRMEIIDLQEKEYFIEQYVHLRNRYAELLLTSPVTISETKEWFKKDDDIEVRGLVQDNILLGVVILYLNKDGEISFFVKSQNKGIGSHLLHIVAEVAGKKNLEFIWGWVLKDNFIAQRVFEKNGFVKQGISERKYRGEIKQGIRYKKCFFNHPYDR
jgi:GNAT superfamily N-acetyltransferase